MIEVTVVNSIGEPVAVGEYDSMTGLCKVRVRSVGDSKQIGPAEVRLDPNQVDPASDAYPVYFDAEQLKCLQRVLDDASVRVADPEAAVFNILEKVRAARRYATGIQS